MYSFPKGITAKGNTISLVKVLNSGNHIPFPATITVALNTPLCLMRELYFGRFSAISFKENMKKQWKLNRYYCQSSLCCSSKS